MDISIEIPSEKFKNHLSHPTNSRVLFSGKFGTGKSYFLRKYFTEIENNINLFWLSPVNYVVGANQDIFEWIKIDIAKQLTTEYIIPSQNEKFSKSLLVQTYIYQNAASIFERLIFTLGETTEKIKTGTEVLRKFKSDYKLYKEFEKGIIEESKSEKTRLSEFLEKSFQNSGSIYEDDLTTRTLRASVEFLKLKTKKENILVIDDLDRLDPEHIFRILNILSSHNDHFDTNKFNFDKVILVCDLDNIDHIYKYRYGPNCDFDGYIEKFYTYEPFYFSIKDAIIESCNKLALTEDIDSASKNVMILLLKFIFRHKQLKIRNLKKLSVQEDLASDIDFPTKIYKHNIASYGRLHRSIIGTSNFEINYNQYSILKVIYLISVAFGGLNKFRDALNYLKSVKAFFNPSDIDDIILSMAALSHIAKNDPHDNSTLFKAVNLGDQYHKLYELTTPTASFLGKSYPMPVKWRTGNLYTTGEYFTFEPGRLLGIKHNVDPSQTNKYSLLIEEFILIVDFIKSNKLFSNLSD